MTVGTPASPLLDEGTLRAIEDASLNASAPPQQRWVDGWLVRTSPGKAKRARCIQPVAAGFRPLSDRLATCDAVFREASLPTLFRITPFAEPAGLDGWLQARGWQRFDDTLVMARWLAGDAAVPPTTTGPEWGKPDDALVWGKPDDAPAWAGAPVQADWVSPHGFAQAVGTLRGSPAAEIDAHAQRLAFSPVPVAGLVWRSRRGELLAAGQCTREQAIVGLYDIHVAAAARRQGLGLALCRALLARATEEGACIAYLQVDVANQAAQSVYRRLGFADAYRYHYRSAEVGAD